MNANLEKIKKQKEQLEKRENALREKMKNDAIKKLFGKNSDETIAYILDAKKIEIIIDGNPIVLNK